MSDCILWKGAVNNKGYGHRYVNGKYWLAHRYAYFITNGDIPPGLMVMHTCDNRCCINPIHLKLGTNADNMRDAREKGRTGKTESGRNGSRRKWRNAAIRFHNYLVPR